MNPYYIILWEERGEVKGGCMGSWERKGVVKERDSALKHLAQAESVVQLGEQLTAAAPSLLAALTLTICR